MSANGNLERILESAVILFWADLMRGTPTGLIHIEYGFAPPGTLINLALDHLNSAVSQPAVG
jgi:hypothetical protein